ncbi:rap guanine nucleotide exchange factor 5 [Sminthopsis crassicaudata]|uniref:rap guanine nucleotide exchange factor 5 n=1 Tax=Sminthopsis crassicaudata TaxID=9301 RepID=UPI003D69B526
MKMAVGAVKMQPPPAESPEPAEPGASGGRRQLRPGGGPGAPEPPQPPEPQLRHRLRDLPALLRSGLTLRRKRSAGGGGRALARRISNPYLEHTASQIYGENSSCAGRALRNIFTVQASDLIKDRVNLKGVYRRSCVGSELVDWLLENCPFVQCRSMAVGVWQLLLDMGIILSVDHQLYFQDTYVFYQFSSDECSYLYCEYERAEEWQNGVRLLLQLVPLSPARADDCDLPQQKIEDTEETSDELLVRLTSAVQRELAAVIAFKARKAGERRSRTRALSQRSDPVLAAAARCEPAGHRPKSPSYREFNQGGPRAVGMEIQGLSRWPRRTLDRPWDAGARNRLPPPPPRASTAQRAPGVRPAAGTQEVGRAQGWRRGLPAGLWAGPCLRCLTSLIRSRSRDGHRAVVWAFGHEEQPQLRRAGATWSRTIV